MPGSIRENGDKTKVMRECGREPDYLPETCEADIRCPDGYIRDNRECIDG